MTQRFSNADVSNWGLYVYDDSLGNQADIGIALNWGLITWTPPGANNCATAFKAESGIKGPNDSEYRTAPSAQMERLSGDIPALEFFRHISVAQRLSVTSPNNHFRVGAHTSKAAAYARLSVSGAVARQGGDDTLLAIGHAKLAPAQVVVNITVDGGLELTDRAEP